MIDIESDQPENEIRSAGTGNRNVQKMGLIQECPFSEGIMNTKYFSSILEIEAEEPGQIQEVQCKSFKISMINWYQDRTAVLPDFYLTMDLLFIFQDDILYSSILDKKIFKIKKRSVKRYFALWFFFQAKYFRWWYFTFFKESGNTTKQNFETSTILADDFSANGKNASKQYFDAFLKFQPQETAFYLTKEKIEAIVHENFDLFSELFLNGLFANSAQVSRALANSAQCQGAALISDLFGQFGGPVVDSGPRVLLAHRVTPIVQLVIAGVKGKGLHDVTSGPQKFPVKALN